MIIERDYGDETQKSQTFTSKVESKKNSWGIIDEDS